MGGELLTTLLTVDRACIIQLLLMGGGGKPPVAKHWDKSQFAMSLYVTSRQSRKWNTGSTRFPHELHSNPTVPVLRNLERNQFPLKNPPCPLKKQYREQADQALARHRSDSWAHYMWWALLLSPCRNNHAYSRNKQTFGVLSKPQAGNKADHQVQNE